MNIKVIDINTFRRGMIFWPILKRFQKYVRGGICTVTLVRDKYILAVDEDKNERIFYFRQFAFESAISPRKR